jgi:16S rRNA (guanine966-N2)-methyltransferase
MRIIGGQLKGRKLKVAEAKGLRPTTDRVRSAVFNILRMDYSEKRVLDLFAGTGAMGIEAISRGALDAVFVDSGRDSVKMLRRALKEFGITEQGRIMNKKASPALKLLEADEQKFDLVFMDPPYKSVEAEKVLKQLAGLDVLKDEAVIVVEHGNDKEMPEDISRLKQYDQRRYGGTTVTFYENRGI